MERICANCKYCSQEITWSKMCGCLWHSEHTEEYRGLIKEFTPTNSTCEKWESRGN